MADAPPPAKRARHHYDLTKTFDVLVGKEPSQQRFTVHHDLLVQRSEFFKAARSSRWTQPDQPTTLDDHDPDTFSTYLHCLYFGVDAIKDRLNAIAEEYGATNEPTPSTNESDSESSSDESSDSSDSDDAAGNDVLDNGKEGSSSERDSDSNSVKDDGQRKEQKPPNKLTILVNGEEKEATNTLWVGNLSWATEEKTLEQAFVEFGGFRGVRIITKPNGRSHGFGYVEFTSPESAAKALQTRPTLELDGRSLRLDFSTPRPGTANGLKHDQQRQETQEGPENEHHISVGAVDVDTNDVNISQTIQDEVSMIDYNTDYGEDEDDVDNAKTRVLIKLYMLADKLIDPYTANLVIDTLISHVDALEHLPDGVFTNIVYRYTPTGSPLRALFRDWHIHELCHCAYPERFDAKNDLPVQFLKDVLVETGQICSKNGNRKISDVLRSEVIGRPTGHYHQKSGRSQSNDGQ